MFNLYCIYIIKNYILVNEGNEQTLLIILNQIDIEFLISITNLLNKNNKKLSYDILYILINISYAENGEKLFALDEKIIINIAKFLGNNKNDSTLLGCGIWLIKNITYLKEDTENESIEIFLHYKIINFFEEIYERHLLNINFMTNLMSCLWNFIIYKLKNKNDILYLLPTIKIIKTQLRPNLISDILYKYVYLLYKLTSYNSSNIYYEMINYKIHKELMNIYPFCSQRFENINTKNIIQDEEYKKNLKDIENYKNICLIILKILGKIMSLEDGILTQTLLDSGIAKFLNMVLQSHDITVIKNASFCISNICAGTYGQISNLYDNNTLFELIKVAKNIYEALNYNGILKNEQYNKLKDAFREINYVFSLTIINSIYEKSIPFARYDNFTVVLILLKGLDIIENNVELFRLIISAIYRLLVYDRTDKYKDKNLKENNNNNNSNLEDNIQNLSISEFMERNGIKEIAQKLKYSKIDDNTVRAFENIYNEVFNEVEVEENL